MSMSHPPRLWRIGLTGGMGSGKSTVAGMLAECGAAVIDADAISRSLTAAGGRAMPEIRRQFGDAMVDEVPSEPDAGKLLAEARAAADHAHAPYSGWHVGAAAVFSEAPLQIHRGANVENGSFGLTICAERTAIATAVTANAQEPVQVVKKESTGVFANPVVLTLVALLAASVLGNVVLLAALLRH